MDSGHTREDTNAPSYDSSDEWEIGLGNLIIDLDADLEKDGHHEGAPAHLDASPMKVGKMKIKRKVSSNAPKGEGASPVTIRKDSNASTGSSVMDDASPDAPTRPEDQIGKPTVNIPVPHPGGIGASSSSLKRETIPALKLDKLAPGLAIKPIVSNMMQLKPSSSTTTSSSPSTMSAAAITTPPQSAPPIAPVTRPSTLTLPVDAAKQQQKPHKSPGEEGVGGEEGKKMKIEKDCKVEVAAAGKRSGGEPYSSGRKHGGKKAKVDKPLRHSIAVDTMDIGVATEPESIGPCEPGTSVNLEGIVWHETDQGVLVVNVTWRNKTYVGTLMDCTRHDWAAPRFCDSPTSDMENRGKGSGRPKRGRNANSSSNDLSNYTETRSSIHSKLRNSTKGRRGSNASNGTRTPPCTIEKNTSKRKTKESDVEETVQTNKRQKTGVRPPVPANEDRHTPVLIECPQPNCNKKYKHKNGLHYHLSHAHNNVLDKDGNWRERTEYDDDSKSNSSDDIGVTPVQSSDKKKDLKDKKESSKEEEEEEERMDVDKGDAKTPEEESVPSGSPAGSVDSNSEGSAHKKGEAAKNKDITKSPKAHKGHVDKFTAGMKCLGIPKPKEAKSSPSKAPKNDAGGEKPGKVVRKQQPPPGIPGKDLSIFDFNSAPDDPTAANAIHGGTPEKHVGVSVIRPNPEPTPIKSEPVSPNTISKAAAAAAEQAKGPKPHMSTNSDQGAEDRNAKKTDKEKFKADKHKKAKHDKVAVKTGKTIRPIAPAPAPSTGLAPPTTQAPPPQLIAIPTALVQNPVSVSCTLTVPPTNTPIQAKPQTPLGSPALKPIQPKPATTSPAQQQDVSGSILAMKDKDKKSKQKKKVRIDKEKEKDRLPSSPMDSSKSAKEQLGEQRLKNNPLLPAVLETNILKQALTASGIVEPENVDKSKGVASEMWKRDGSKIDAPLDRVTKVLPPSQDKPASTAPVSNVAMPQIPKLIPTSSVTATSSRTSKQLPLPPQHPQHPMQPSHLQTPSQIPHQPPMALPPGIKIPVVKPDSISQDRSSSNLSVHTSLVKDGPKNTRLLSPPSGNRTGNISPAYSDISEDGVDDQSKSTKPSDAFSYERPDHLKPHSEPSQRLGESNPGGERLPMFHGSDSRTGTPEVVGSGSIVQGKPGHDRDDGKKGENKDQSAPRSSSSINPTLPPNVPHVYSGSHYSYLHGYVNMDPSYHMRLMATDPQYRQQQERLMEEQRKRVEKLRAQEGSEKSGESKGDSVEKRRPVINIQTEPITPPQPPRHPDSRERSREKDHVTKSRHIEFSKKEGGSPSTARTPESDKQNSAMLLEKRQREEMRQYYLYQQKLMEQPHRQAEEARKTVEQENRKKENVELSKKDLSTPEQGDKSRTPTPTHRNVSTPTKETSGRLSADPEKRDTKSPLGKGAKPDGKKLIEGYPYLQPPYPYGTIPFDPSHPTFQPMVYPSFMHPDLRYPAAGATPAWKSPSEKQGFEQEPDRASSSPHSLSSKGGKSPDASDFPSRALDVLQQHTNQYFSPSQKHGSNSRPRTPEKGRTTPVQRSRSSSPAARKSPETSSSSSSISSSREDGKRGTVHQHMHTHQHTHVGVPVGVTYPVLPPYDQYVMASQQAAAAAAASASAAAVNQYSRREKQT